MNTFSTNQHELMQSVCMWRGTMSQTVKSSTETHGPRAPGAKLAPSTSWAEADMYSLIFMWSAFNGASERSAKQFKIYLVATRGREDILDGNVSTV